MPPPPEPGAPVVAAIRVEAEEGADAVPPRAWQPPQDPAAGLALDHQPGTPLGAAWIERQFALNTIEGGPIDRALALVQLINRAFLSAGFINSGLLVPPQAEGAAGTLVLRLVHGRLSAPPATGEAVAVAWAGGDARGLDGDYVRAFFGSAQHRPLDVAAIERDFRRLADDPAIRTVDAELVPGATPGEASLSLTIVPADRFDLYLAAGNSRSPSVGGERAAIGGGVRNVLLPGDQLSGEAGVTEGCSTPRWAGRSRSPRLAPACPCSGTSTAPPSSTSRSRRSTSNSRETALESELVHRLIDAPLLPRAGGGWAPSRQLSAGLGLVWRRQQSFLLGLPFSFAPGSVDGRAEYVAARLLGDFVLRGVDEVFALSATGTIGLWGTRADRPFVLDPDRHFLSLLVQANYARRLDRHGLELRARATGQWSHSTLYSGERLAIGGYDTVRGYRETLVLADQGLIGSLELARPFTLSGDSVRPGAFDWGAFTLAAFADAAFAANAADPQLIPDQIASIGLSLEWHPHEALSLTLAYGYALKDARQTGERDLQDRGVHFRFIFRPLQLD